MLVVATAAFALPDQSHDSALSRSRLRSNRHRAQAHELVERQAPSGSDYLGCVQDGPARLLTGTSITSNSMNVDTCIKSCSAQGYIYAGVESEFDNKTMESNADNPGSNQCYVSPRLSVLDGH